MNHENYWNCNAMHVIGKAVTTIFSVQYKIDKQHHDHQQAISAVSVFNDYYQ